MEPGNAAEWTSAIAALVAVLAAISAGVIGFKSYSLQRQQTAHQLSQYRMESEQTRSESRKQQASAVAIWLAFGDNDWHVWVANSSTLPVYDLNLKLVVGDDTRAVARSVLGPCRTRRSAKLTAAVRRALADMPGSQHEGGRLHEENVAMEISFRDSAGVRWRRDRAGLLQEMTSEGGAG